MKNEMKKISKIVEELMDFYLLAGASNLDISLSHKDTGIEITAHSNSVNCTNQEVENLIKLLSLKRQREIEEYSWQLAGSDDTNDELGLIGMMIDEAHINFSSPILTVKLVRYK